MREGIAREVEMQYEAQRAANHREEARRLMEAAQADPEIGRLVDSRQSLFARQAREAFARPADALAIGESLRQEMAALQASLRSRLMTAGFPADYLQPVYACTRCHDTGHVGEPIRERCTCYAERALALAMARDDHGLLPEETFEAYRDEIFSKTPLPHGREDSQRSYMARIRTRCEAYADEFPDGPRRNLLFFGKSGLGKTYLMNAIGNRVRARGDQVLKLTAYQFTERSRAAIFNRDEDAFSLLLEIPLLLLDDLGVEPIISNITLEQLFTLLNERGLRRLHTVISTNLMVEELEKRYNERICSRLFDRQNTMIIEFLGDDVRMR